MLTHAVVKALNFYIFLLHLIVFYQVFFSLIKKAKLALLSKRIIIIFNYLITFIVNCSKKLHVC